nr:MAG TPA: hypothetical protein [Herelleviridae sp.]
MNEMVRSFPVAIRDVEGMVFDALLTFDGFNLVSVHRVAFDSEEPMRVCERHSVEDVEEILHFEDFGSEELHGDFLGEFLSIGDTCSLEEVLA